ncbi:hypothetical protein EDD17DRAFT_343087 [Pisolithus thermaeus]|nr:hypothetical protein EDD17DRAFT_343087 [Pisolithus thermaeus]
MADPLQESLKNKRLANRALLAAGVAGVLLYVLYSPGAKRNQGDSPKAPSRNNESLLSCLLNVLMNSGSRYCNGCHTRTKRSSIRKDEGMIGPLSVYRCARSVNGKDVLGSVYYIYFVVCSHHHGIATHPTDRRPSCGVTATHTLGTPFVSDSQADPAELHFHLFHRRL